MFSYENRIPGKQIPSSKIKKESGSQWPALLGFDSRCYIINSKNDLQKTITYYVLTVYNRYVLRILQTP